MWTISYITENFVSRHRGTLPVLLTCPHGGGEQPPDVPERTGEGIPSDCHFQPSADLRTREVTVGVAQRILEICGEAPYVVIADFHRKFIDANRRAPECAYEVPAAQRYYDEYHGGVLEFVDEINAENGGLGLLFDIHGTAGIDEDPADLYLGTDNGNSVARLLTADPSALFRRRSLRGFLQAGGYVVSPKQPGIPETPTLDGGHTVKTYGSSNVGGLDAVQIEIAAPHRIEQDQRERLIEHLAYAIVNLVDRYADAHTLSAFRSTQHSVNGTLIGQWQRRAMSNDARLRVGGRAQSRGRIEIRRDPGESAAARARAGVLVLYDQDGRDYFLWVDVQGKLRIATSDPGDSGLAGTIVGTQA